LKYYGKEGTTIFGDGKFYWVEDGNSNFGFSNPDFNILSFRSNLIWRWEYHPESTIYLVYQQNKYNFENSTGKVDFDIFIDSYKVKGNNSIALKMSYWLPVD